MMSRGAEGSVKAFHSIEWVVVTGVLVTIFVAWGQSRNVFARGIDELSLFPLFGLVAFVLMWSHFVFGAVRRLMGLRKSAAGMYWSISSAFVLALIILHPLLLNYRFIVDGLGLPPMSYELAYGSKAVFLMLGTVCLLVFLMFELRRWFSRKTWWKYIEGAQIAAMIGIFIHALVLGQELRIGWFLVLWWCYGLLLVAAWVYNHEYDKRLKLEEVASGKRQ